MKLPIMFTFQMDFGIKPLIMSDFKKLKENIETNEKIATSIKNYIASDYTGNNKWMMNIEDSYDVLTPKLGHINVQIETEEQFNYRYMDNSSILDALKHTKEFPKDFGPISIRDKIHIPFALPFGLTPKGIKIINSDFQMQRKIEASAFSERFTNAFNIDVNYLVDSPYFGRVDISFETEENIEFKEIMDYLKCSYNHFVFPKKENFYNIRGIKLRFEDDI